VSNYAESLLTSLICCWRSLIYRNSTGSQSLKDDDVDWSPNPYCRGPLNLSRWGNNDLISMSDYAESLVTNVMCWWCFTEIAWKPAFIFTIEPEVASSDVFAPVAYSFHCSSRTVQATGCQLPANKQACLLAYQGCAVWIEGLSCAHLELPRIESRASVASFWIEVHSCAHYKERP
jgi:hypothetical protein